MFKYFSASKWIVRATKDAADTTISYQGKTENGSETIKREWLKRDLDTVSHHL